MRHDDWEERLAGYLAGLDGAAFEWGRLDCVIFAAGAVKTVTGTELGIKRGYKSQAGAFRALKQAGFTSLPEAVDSLLTPVEVAFARRGDVLMHNGNLGICIGRDGLFLSDKGWARVPVLSCEKAWANG